jgi:hypothetical protein
MSGWIPRLTAVHAALTAFILAVGPDSGQMIDVCACSDEQSKADEEFDRTCR